MSAVAATYFDGRTSRALRVQVTRDAEQLTIHAADWQRRELPASIRVTPRVAGIHRTLTLCDGAQLQVADNDAVDAWFPGRDRTAALVDRLERHPAAVAVSLLVTVIGVVFVVFFGIPMAASKVADYIPDSVAREMGEQTVTLLDRFGFEKSALPQQRRDELQSAFKRYVADLPDAQHFQLRFMRGPANAFALPGGVILVTDSMVRIVGAAGAEGPPEKNAAVHFSNTDGSDAGPAPDARDGEAAAEIDAAADERFLAVIAHEVGHEEHKHVLRSVLQSSAVVLAGAYFTGDVSSASALVVSVPTFLLDSHYSRDFEAEADEYAFASLAAHGISPQRFAEVMTAMQTAEPHLRHETGYLSTHPPTLQRIMRAREAAEEFSDRKAKQ